MKFNAVIIAPDYSPTAMIPAYVPQKSGFEHFVSGLKNLTARCDEFVSPIHPSITEQEIKAVLSAAQRAFGMIDIIAPNYPLRIHRLDYSHIAYNSECALTNGNSRQSLIFLYHPREFEPYDRVFIFAHELGHALHFALTGDVDIIPESFDRFNNSISTTLKTLKEKQEAFADAAAIAILASPNSRLKSHLPTDWCRMISPSFVRYFKGLLNCDVT